MKTPGTEGVGSEALRTPAGAPAWKGILIITVTLAGVCVPGDLSFHGLSPSSLLPRSQGSHLSLTLERGEGIWSSWTGCQPHLGPALTP